MSKLNPNFTQIPNYFLDEISYSLSPSQIKVALYIMRRTYGFRKMSDRISISQICRGIKDRDGNKLDNGTGLSNRSVIDALNALESIGLIKMEKRPNCTTRITINTSGENISLVKKVHGGGENISLEVVKKVHTQKKEKESYQKKDIDGQKCIQNVSKMYPSELLSECLARFEQFWQHYPKKVGKSKAIKEWQKLKPTSELVNQIISHLQKRVKTTWVKENKRFVVHPERFIRDCRWEDELEPVDKGIALKTNSGMAEKIKAKYNL
jgi:hypothetical protein